MSAHTPGPWRIVDAGMRGVECRDEKGRVIFDTAPIAHGNARLIAAAPELLAACREAENALADYVPTLEHAGGLMNYGHAVLRQLRAALAKVDA